MGRNRPGFRPSRRGATKSPAARNLSPRWIVEKPHQLTRSPSVKETMNKGGLGGVVNLGERKFKGEVG